MGNMKLGLDVGYCNIGDGGVSRGAESVSQLEEVDQVRMI